MDLTGRTIGERYRVEHKLSSTWMSATWLAVEEGADREVRIRVPYATLTKNAGFANVALAELRALAGVKKQGIQTVLEAGEEDGLPYGVLEAARGGSLADRVGARPLDLDVVANWLPTIASALDRLHDRGTVHRDVSASNLVFDASGEARLADPGFSEALMEVAPQLGPPIEAPGELGDLPPEILEHSIGPAYDQYSLAAVVFLCLAGRSLQPSDSYLGVGQALADTLPPEAVEVLERALSVVPGERYSSCGAFATTFLDAAGAESPEMEKTGTLMMDARDLAKKAAAKEPPPREETGEIPVAAPLAEEEDVSTEIPAASLTSEVRIPPAESRPGKKKRSALPWIVLVLLLLGGGGFAAFQVLGKKETPRDESPRNEPPPVVANGDEDPTPTPAPKPEPKPEPVAVGRVVLASPADGAVVGANRIEVAGRVEGTAERVMVADVRATPDADGRFSAEVALDPGENLLTVTPWTDDTPGESVRLRILCDATAPIVEIDSPADGFATRDASVRLEGRVRDDRPDVLLVNGEELALTGDGSFDHVLDLPDGETTVRIRARDRAGNESTPVELQLLRDDVDPVVSIRGPEPDTVSPAPEVDVSGSVTDHHPDRVRVNGIEAKLDADGSYTARLQLPEGEHEIVVTAFDRAGNRGEAKRTVIVDTTPPRVVVANPADGATVTADSVGVNGRVVDENPHRVTVAGEPVGLGADGSFATPVRLAPGPNRIEVVAEDRAGNRSEPFWIRVNRPEARVSLRLDPPAFDRTTASTVTITGTISPAGATVRAGGSPATVSDGRFEVEVPLEPGRKGVDVVAEMAGAEPVRATFAVARIGFGEATAGPGTLRTAGGETLVLEAGAELVALPPGPQGAEAFRLGKGQITATLGDRTRVNLPVGHVVVPEGGRAKVRIGVPAPGRVALAVEEGRAQLANGRDRLLVAAGQSAAAEWNGPGAGRLRFRAGPENRGSIRVTRQATTKLVIELEVPAGTNGMLEPTNRGNATSVASAADSEGTMRIQLTWGEGSGAEGTIEPGQARPIPHPK